MLKVTLPKNHVGWARATEAREPATGRPASCQARAVFHLRQKPPPAHEQRSRTTQAVRYVCAACARAHDAAEYAARHGLPSSQFTVLILCHIMAYGSLVMEELAFPLNALHKQQILRNIRVMANGGALRNKGLKSRPVWVLAEACLECGKWREHIKDCALEFKKEDFAQRPNETPITG